MLVASSSWDIFMRWIIAVEGLILMKGLNNILSWDIDPPPSLYTPRDSRS
jgi:hypothetical protein